MVREIFIVKGEITDFRNMKNGLHKFLIVADWKPMPQKTFFLNYFLG